MTDQKTTTTKIYSSKISEFFFKRMKILCALRQIEHLIYKGILIRSSSTLCVRGKWDKNIKAGLCRPRLYNQ